MIVILTILVNYGKIVTTVKMDNLPEPNNENSNNGDSNNESSRKRKSDGYGNGGSPKKPTCLLDEFKKYMEIIEYSLNKK
jgi:hypothetical protein